MTVVIERAEDRTGWLESLKASDDCDEVIMQKFMRASPHLWRGMVDDKVACIWGLIPPSLLSNQAYLWFYTTKYADEHQFLLVRYSQRIIEMMLKEYESLVGHTAIGNDRAIRWLRWLGAEFGTPHGKFIPFRIGRKDG